MGNKGTYIFDCETDALLDDATKMHSLVLMDCDTGEIISCAAGAEGYHPISHGLKLLRDADKIIGHNAMMFDVPVIKKLYPKWSTQAKLIDTLICTRLYWPDLRDADFARTRQRGSSFPSQLIGRHNLEAWGYRLGLLKDEFGKTTDWQDWSKEMQDYCEQDVKVTRKLYEVICAKLAEWGEESFNLEHAFADIIRRQIDSGFTFNVEKAAALYAELAGRKETLAQQLREIFPPLDKGDVFVPKANNASRGYVKGVPVKREKLQEFNPSSRDHIAERLIAKYGWKPETYTKEGKPEISEDVLTTLPYPEAALLSEYLMLDKRVGQLSTGNQAWLKLHKDGVIHGGVITNGAVTGRCTHSGPNMAQVPAVGAPYGAECRALFGPPKGFYQIGCDASGLELRCLAHYLGRYDDGAYRDIILLDDVHTVNQIAAGLPTRAHAKTFAYGLIYGAGDEKLGSIVCDKTMSADEKQKAGKALRKKFLKNMPALDRLISDVKNVAKKRGHLVGLDGRQLHVRSQHSALNLLLQSAGAIIMKKATCLFWDSLRLKHGESCYENVLQMAHIHDEFQLAVRKYQPEDIGGLAVKAIRDAGEYFNFRCPLDGEWKQGTNWAETH